MELYVLGAGVFVFLAHLLDALFERTRVPDILMLMILGIVAGPALGLIEPAFFGQVGRFMGALALVVILFEGGLNISLTTLLKTATRALPFSLLTFVASMVSVASITTLLLGIDPWVGMATGAILGGTSSAVVIPVVRALKASEPTSVLLSMESALTDVFCIVVTVGIVGALSAGGDGVAAGALLTTAGGSFAFALLLGVVAGGAWTFAISRIQRMQNASLATLAFALVTYGLAEVLGLSGAIAALTLGVVLGNVEGGKSVRIELSGSSAEPLVLRTGNVSRRERKVYAEVVFLLKAFFFFHLGLTARPMDFLAVGGVVALVLAVLPLLPRYPIARFLVPRATPRREALLVWAMGPRGLAAAVLAQLLVQHGLDDGELMASIVAMMVFVSISICSIAVLAIERGWLDALGARVFVPFAGGAASAAAAAAGAPPAADEAAGAQATEAVAHETVASS